MRALGLIAAMVCCTAFLFAQDQADTVVNPLAGNAQAIAAGRAVYVSNCSVCHGGSAQGDRGPSLVSGSFTHGGADGQLASTIRMGVPGTQMPAFNQLSSDQVWQVIAFLRDLSGVTSVPGPANEAYREMPLPGNPFLKVKAPAFPAIR
jgi:mono/diheme cytochrome c family protein